MRRWYMLTVVGEDRSGIVVRLTQALFEAGCNLGEASMIRLGGNFTVMLMVQSDLDAEHLRQVVDPVAKSLGLRIHVDTIDARLHQHIEPDVRVVVHGADRAGIVARVTGLLAEQGVNILNLESDVAGSEAQPIYLLLIEGRVDDGFDRLHEALAALAQEGVEVRVEPIQTLVG
jgi:glycine cleavage system transcriptional repressor